MKKIALTITSILLLVACRDDKKQPDQTPKTVQEELPPVSEELMETAVIYEANIRQYSPDGTFDAFTQDIPEIKKLGVKVIWLMPIHPISEVKRKAKGELSIEDIDDPEERKKYLGSYYAVADYTAINPAYGTEEDFRELVNTAHENGIYVILDWVANHTGWDHSWLEAHPEYYTKNDLGEIIDPLDPQTGESWGWTDVADLNYDNMALWGAMTGEMNYWVKEFDIDGFRADVAGEVPTEFWEQAFREIEEIKPLFLLAESEDKDLFLEAFDMGYNWEGHHIMNSMAQGKSNVAAWDAYMKKIDSTYQDDDFLMNFVTNHDENAWSGTVKERMGNASETMLAMSYMIPGMPLIYSGQEYGLDHRLLFFEKDSIPKIKETVWELMEKLGNLKNNNPALNGGKEAAEYNRVETSADDHILAFIRTKKNEELLFIANLSEVEVNFSLEHEGTYENFMTSKKENLSKGLKLSFDPWEYKILLKK